MMYAYERVLLVFVCVCVCETERERETCIRVNKCEGERNLRVLRELRVCVCK